MGPTQKQKWEVGTCNILCNKREEHGPFKKKTTELIFLYLIVGFLFSKLTTPKKQKQKNKKQKTVKVLG